MAQPGRFSEALEGDKRVLRFEGDLTLACLGDLPRGLERVNGGAPLVADVTRVGRMDTVGAWLLYRLRRDHGAQIRGEHDDIAVLLEQVAQGDKPVKVRPDRTPPLYRVMGQMGAATVVAGRTMFGLLGFFGSMLISIWNVITHPRRFR